MIKLMVVDDHDLVRTGIVRLLSDCEQIEVIAQASSGEEAIKLARIKYPNVVLMDVRMPGIDGLEATRRLKRFDPSLEVIALSAYDSDHYITRLMQAGASGFLSKGSEVSEMVRAILKVKSGQLYLSSDVAQRFAIKSFFPEQQASPFSVLSNRELQIARLIVNCSKVLEISDQLHLSPKTINTYRYRIFEKLGVTSDVELTHMGVKHGLVESEEVKA